MGKYSTRTEEEREKGRAWIKQQKYKHMPEEDTLQRKQFDDSVTFYALNMGCGSHHCEHSAYELYLDWDAYDSDMRMWHHHCDWPEYFKYHYNAALCDAMNHFHYCLTKHNDMCPYLARKFAEDPDFLEFTNPVAYAEMKTKRKEEFMANNGGRVPVHGEEEPKWLLYGNKKNKK